MNEEKRMNQNDNLICNDSDSVPQDQRQETEEQSQKNDVGVFSKLANILFVLIFYFCVLFFMPLIAAVAYLPCMFIICLLSAIVDVNLLVPFGYTLILLGLVVFVLNVQLLFKKSSRLSFVASILITTGIMLGQGSDSIPHLPPSRLHEIPNVNPYWSLLFEIEVYALVLGFLSIVKRVLCSAMNKMTRLRRNDKR